MSSSSLPCLVTRDSVGLNIYKWNDGKPETHQQSQVECRVCTFSTDGSFFAYADADIGVNVLDMNTGESVLKLDLPRTLSLRFSPQNDLLCTWENFSATRENAYGKENLRVFDMASKQLVYSVVQKDIAVTGLPQWFPSTTECAVLTGNTINFFPNAGFKNAGAEIGHLHIEKLTKFELSPNAKGRQHVACFVRGNKGGPASVRLFPRGCYQQADILANKSFYKADQAQIKWNAKGSAVLVTALLEADSTGQSYYGEQTLHFVSTKGDSSLVNLTKKGPIYDSKWSPDSNFFCVVFGFMPSKAALFNLKCDPIFTFKQAPRNECIFNPHGNLLALCGFGNLRGTIEVWDMANRRQVSEHSAADTTCFEWCPDGTHFLTGTTTPRLRVNNGFKTWHYIKGQESSRNFEKSLFHVSWQPIPHQNFPLPNEHSKSGKAVNFQPAKAPAAYIPPHARGNPGYSPKIAALSDDEADIKSSQPMSKAALKNKRKRNNARKNDNNNTTRDGLSNEQQDAVKMAQYLLGNNGTGGGDKKAQPQAAPVSTGLSEKEKKIKNLRKKLQAIEKLKVQQKEGKVLEKNQVEKLQSEDSMRAELEKLSLE